ncbi:MAG TPA: carbonic anhydrase family protein [Thermoanaerobaculia bacterium]|nr:carbonic anhydrase family protein [Thermoanaerobaculia bacterium]
MSACGAEWGYADSNGPHRWGQMNKEWAACDSGHTQSPIRITQSRYSPMTMRLQYGDFPIAVQNTGHELKVYPLAEAYAADVDAAGATNNLKLIQFHFHVPAEHLIGDETRAAGELHLVHENRFKETVVVAVLIQSQPNDNPAIAALLREIPAACTSVKADSFGGMEDLLPKDRSKFYLYTGSLTTPPCSQPVFFFVMRNPIGASAAQLGKLAISPLPRGNYRPTQPTGMMRDLLVQRSFQ